MKLRYKLGLGALVLGALVFAGTEVDQGKPGKYGSWPVSVTSAIALTSTAVTIDGGNVNVVGNVIVDGGSITPSPSVTATKESSNLQGVTANGTPCTSPGGASCTIIYPSTSFLAYQNVTITIINAGANTLDNVLIEWSPNDSNFEAWDTTTFASLAAGAIKSLAISGNSRRYLRIEGRAAANTTAQIYVQANTQAF